MTKTEARPINYLLGIIFVVSDFLHLALVKYNVWPCWKSGSKSCDSSGSLSAELVGSSNGDIYKIVEVKESYKKEGNARWRQILYTRTLSSHDIKDEFRWIAFKLCPGKKTTKANNDVLINLYVIKSITYPTKPWIWVMMNTLENK